MRFSNDLDYCNFYERRRRKKFRGSCYDCYDECSCAVSDCCEDSCCCIMPEAITGATGATGAIGPTGADVIIRLNILCTNFLSSQIKPL